MGTDWITYGTLSTFHRCRFEWIINLVKESTVVKGRLVGRGSIALPSARLSLFGDDRFESGNGHCFPNLCVTVVFLNLDVATVSLISVRPLFL